ncbi:hypothetical protein V1511DRAFT_499192 [Dipodascopsis uninucleata]
MTITKTLLDAVAEYTTISVDSMWPEGALSIKPAGYFENATSNQFHIWYMFNKQPSLVNDAIGFAKEFGHSEEDEDFIDQVIYYAAAILGRDMLKLIKGCCLSQTNPAFAYDTEKTVASAQGFIKAYNDLGVPTEKVIIKVPSTFQALTAATILKTKGIKTLGTMVHSLAQGIAAAEAGCVAISTYVDELAANIDTSLLKEYDDLEENYGWALTRDIHNYYRAYGIKTRNVAAAMIGVDVTVGLTGIDEMTIPLPCLEKLAGTPAPADFKPRIPAVVDIKDAPPKDSFMNDQAKLDKAIAENKVATFRIKDAIATFVKYDGFTRDIISQALAK